MNSNRVGANGGYGRVRVGNNAVNSVDCLVLFVLRNAAYSELRATFKFDAEVESSTCGRQGNCKSDHYSGNDVEELALRNEVDRTLAGVEVVS